MNISRAPIALFVYNRPDHTRQTVEALKQNALSGESDLIIFSDAAKLDGQASLVSEVRQYIRQIEGFRSISIVEQKINFGLARSIIEGVTAIVNQYGRIIVLEDDIITSPHFLNFMNDALEFYKDVETVMHISGYVYPINRTGLSDTFLLRPASCWGWATWDRSWRLFLKDVDYYLNTFSKKMIYDFNLNNAYPYFDQIRQNRSGRLNTWAVFWYASVYLNNGLSLHPRNSYTRNIGFEGSGTNCASTTDFDVDLVKTYAPTFTDDISESAAARTALENYFNGIKLPLAMRISNKIRKSASALFKRSLRYWKKPQWHNLRSVTPMSRKFAFDRGTPIDRVYIQHFLESNKQYVTGVLCEIGTSEYSKKFGSNVDKYEIFDYVDNNSQSTIVADLSDMSTLPKGTIDCFILTQTLNFIYEFEAAIRGLHHMLKEDGVALVTVAGIAQISRYDMDKWGDYWRFTDLSIKRAFDDVFGKGNVEVCTYGNVLSSIAFLEGISAEELSHDELFYNDMDYQLTIAVKARK